MPSLTATVARFAVFALLGLSLARCSAGVDDEPIGYVGGSGAPRPHDFPIQGIDVSKYQGDVDWSRVADSGVKFAWIKATEGADHIDPKFGQNWVESRAAGVPRGAYHFVYWCRPWQEEIAWYERNVPVEADALPPVLDVEATPGSRTCKRVLYREDVLPEIANMLAELERHYGKRPVIYTSVDFYRTILRPHEFSDYPIWVRSTKYSPPVEYGDRKWQFWQYQSDGSVPGIRGKVDRNAFFGDTKQWLAWLDDGRKHHDSALAERGVATGDEAALQAMQLLPMAAH